MPFSWARRRRERRGRGRGRHSDSHSGEVDLKTPHRVHHTHHTYTAAYSSLSSPMRLRPVLMRRLWTQTIKAVAPRRTRPPSFLFSYSSSSTSSANNSTCPQCGAAFACGCVSLDCNACWCASLPLALSLPLLLSPPSSSSPSDESEPAAVLSCLCPQCLKAKIDEAAKAKEERQLLKRSKT